MGPDLTRTYSRFGPEGMDAMLETLFFPTMVPLYQGRPLTLEEQANLKAFFASVTSFASAPGYTLAFGLIALGGMGVLLAAMGAIWRRRLRAVREPLVRSAIEERS